MKKKQLKWVVNENEFGEIDIILNLDYRSGEIQSYYDDGAIRYFYNYTLKKFDNRDYRSIWFSNRITKQEITDFVN